MGAEEPIDFGRDIRPILSDACFHCHGPDASHREADLRLDTHEGAVADLGGYRAVDIEDPEESEVLRRIASEDPDERMPPDDSGKKISPAQVALLRRWTLQGAPWAEHWGFVAPVRAAVPGSQGPRENAHASGAIDAFLLKRLGKEPLSFSPPADQVTLLRRLSLDLTCLLPTIEEVDRFLADDGKDAYRKQIDRLLASRHYGERWARLWLDAARYSDSDG